jgi:hypothetical protein
VFWTTSLKYTFPPVYLEPINDAFSGALTKLKTRMKIFKKTTDLRDEARVQQQGNDKPGQNQNNLNPDEIRVEIENNNFNNFSTSKQKSNDFKFNI